MTFAKIKFFRFINRKTEILIRQNLDRKKYHILINACKIAAIKIIGNNLLGVIEILEMHINVLYFPEHLQLQEMDSEEPKFE